MQGENACGMVKHFSILTAFVKVPTKGHRKSETKDRTAKREFFLFLHFRAARMRSDV